MPMPLGMGSPINSLPFDLENALYEASKIRTRPVYVDLLRMPQAPSAPSTGTPYIPRSEPAMPAQPYNPNIDRNSPEYQRHMERIRMIEQQRKKKMSMDNGASLADVLDSYV